MPRFHDERIEVNAGGVPLRPISFNWKGELHQIATIDSEWHDWHVGTGGPRRVAWKHRRHRNYFRVTTTEGRVFEIYYDRKGRRPDWILYRELE